MTSNRCAPQFLKPLSGTMEITEGEELVLDVTVHGKPAPEVEWTLNGDEIKICRALVNDEHHRLVIPAVSKQHTGEYRASVQNSSGRVSSALWLAVVPQKTRRSAYVANRSASMNANNSNSIYFSNPIATSSMREERPYGSLGRAGSVESLTGARRAPGFLSRPKPSVVRPGEEITLKASLLGQPSPRVTWEKNGRLVAEDERTTISSEGKQHVLSILRACHSDSGTYKITARNPLGRQYASAAICVSETAESIPKTHSTSTEEDRVSSSQGSSQNRSYAVLGRSPNLQMNTAPPERSTYLSMDKTYENTDTYTVARDYDLESTGSNKSIQSIRSSLKALSVTSRSDHSDTQRSIPSIPYSSHTSTIAPPCVTEPLETVISEVGSYVTIEATVIGGVGEPVWRFNGSSELPNGIFHRRFGDKYRLRVRGIHEDLFGEYSLTVTNAGGSETVSCFIHNKNIPVDQGIQAAADIPVNFKKCLSDANYVEGDCLKLSAELEGYSEPIVRWFFEDERFETSEENEIHLVQNGSIYELHVKNLLVDDSGTYTIVAQHPITSATIESQCEVTVRQAPPSFIHVPAEIRVRAGNGFSLEVEATCTRVTWSYDDQVAEMIAPNRFMFSVDNCTQGGEITIIAENETGMDEGSTNLIVVDPPVNPPRIIQDLPSEAEAKLGEPIMLTIKYTGLATSITWMLNDAPLPVFIDVYSRTLAEGGYSQISIEKMALECEGLLTCMIANKSHTKVSKCNIRYTRVAPDFTSTPVEQISVTEGSPLVLGCEFTGVPVPTVTWMKNKEPVTNALFTENESVSKLEIASTTEDDEGQYHLIVQNEAGLASYTVNVKVNQKIPEPPREETEPAAIIEHLKDKTFIEQDDIVLRCRVTGKPTPTICWYFLEELIWEGPPDDEGLTELVLKDCWAEDMGKYSVKATNSTGSVSSSCYVKVHLRIRPMHEQQVAVEPMETIVEVSEHSRTTSADSHRTEQNESEWDENPNITLTMSNLEEKQSEAEAESGNSDVFIRREVTTNEYFTAVDTFDRTAAENQTYTVQNLKFDKSRLDSRENSSFADNSMLPAQNETYTVDKFSLSAVREQSAPEFIQASDDVAKDGKPFEWTFEISNCDQLSIQRMNDDEAIDLEIDGSDFILERIESTFRFSIREVFPDDAGLYKLHASNEFASSSKTLNLAVEKDGSEPKIVKRPSSTEVHENDLLTLSAVTVGDPMPEICWKLNARTFSEGRTDGVTVTVNYEGDQVCSTLKILKFDNSLAGKALFVAQNVHAEVQAPFLLTLIRPDSAPKPSFDDTSVNQFDFRSQLKSRVETKSVTADDLRSHEVEQVDFRSNLKKSKTAENLADIQDEEPESLDELHKALAKRLAKQQNNPSTSSESDGDQRGLYAENSAASSSSKASTVQQVIAPSEEPPESFEANAEPVADSDVRLGPFPRFLKPLTDREFALGQPFELSVEVIHADEVIWTLEDQVIEAEPEEGLHLLTEAGTSFPAYPEGKTHILRVASSMMEDTGTYEVFLKNSSGTSSSSASVNIYAPNDN